MAKAQTGVSGEGGRQRSGKSEGSWLRQGHLGTRGGPGHCVRRAGQAAAGHRARPAPEPGGGQDCSERRNLSEGDSYMLPSGYLTWHKPTSSPGSVVPGGTKGAMDQNARAK
ncbi:hypothetical protein Y1Q_0001707 [Alligator mississippiensis]|uniref:Uncharacterized protein n=1 Tax=Alligator mississippiensis TaxID=8496 RepID=A0A151MAH0_ALLMI|nr:hypothetical protein Y1Q_0001707 [Alligator mississippiensis]